ncbi:MAG: 1-deoxy-D-xylulose-5-phosphate reductoisomerase [Candidatus Brocadiaceae bacterium]|nr:1-deoxy-D-xylulose-5-phosphate reductoisomerase [Candidatus Brocadiaceae bacterium]
MTGAAAARNVVVLGSTGSVGSQALSVVRSMGGRVRVVGLSGGSRWRDLAAQAREFGVEAVSVADREDALRLRDALDGCGTEVLWGAEGLRRLAGWGGADVVLSAVSGGVGLPAAVAALEAGKTLALANKEAMVMFGPALMALAREGGGAILPVDSEHSALFQLLRSVPPEEVARIVLTASGGPFRGMTRSELTRVTAEDALRHPTWQMGRKITVDSATLMNKALEIIEARWLFGLPADRIGVVIHPQSVVHCLVELVDGSVLAHMGAPDMRLPIQYALSYPERTAGPVERLDLARLGGLEFCEPDFATFPALALGYRVAREGGTSGAVLSAANEVAVAAFLNGEVSLPGVVDVVEDVMDRHSVEPAAGLAAVMAADRWAREEAQSCLHRP